MTELGSDDGAQLWDDPKTTELYAVHELVLWHMYHFSSFSKRKKKVLLSRLKGL